MNRMKSSLGLFFAAALCAPFAWGAGAEPPQGREFYWNSIVNIHIDNHSTLVGKGMSAEEIAARIRDLPGDFIQVSAFGNAAILPTYPSAVLPNPELDGWDTLAVWKRACELAGKRFHIYLNTKAWKAAELKPEWRQLNAAGMPMFSGKGQHGACARPSADGAGLLEARLLPILREVCETYRPGGLWIDGDHSRSLVCYCAHCKAAWKARTGKSEPPVSASDPDWPAWVDLEIERFDDTAVRWPKSPMPSIPTCSIAAITPSSGCTAPTTDAIPARRRSLSITSRAISATAIRSI